MALIADIETNGLLDEVTRVHVMGLKDTKTGKKTAIREAGMKGGLQMLDEATTIVMHNGIKFDVPALQKIYPWWNPKQHTYVDTLVLSRVIYPHLADLDYRRKDFPPRLIGSHSLEAWGFRLGLHKDGYEGDTSIADEAERKARKWESWNQDMEDYCLQDLEVTHRLYDHLKEQQLNVVSWVIEHLVAWIVARQERHGFWFNQQNAIALYGTLSQRKHELEVELQKMYGYIYKKAGPAKTRKIPELSLPDNYKELSKADQKKARLFAPEVIPAGVPYCEVKHVPFNPGSRDDIINVLVHLHGWKPTVFTDGGKPQVDETSLKGMSFPTAPLFTEYFLVTKRISQVAEGKEAWLKHVKVDGRVHGSVNTNGAVTGRMTHSKPNMAQVPAGYSPYGHECRACFGVPPGKKQVGADASALELRDLAGYMARYDGGAYVNTVVNGKKEDGTEMHTVNRKALEIDSRDDAKTWFYAFIYGAGDEKLGSILLKTSAERKAYWEANESARWIYQQRREQGRPVTKGVACMIDRGAKAREAFLKNIPALGELTKAVQAKAKKQGYLVGLDGRKLYVRGQHSALNTLLQSAGAVQMKLALIILDCSLQAKGLLPGKDYEFIANVHDEWQIECEEELADEIGTEAVKSIQRAGYELGFGCPLDGEYKVGNSWADTH